MYNNAKTVSLKLTKETKNRLINLEKRSMWSYLPRLKKATNCSIYGRWNYTCQNKRSKQNNIKFSSGSSHPK